MTTRHKEVYLKRLDEIFKQMGQVGGPEKVREDILDLMDEYANDQKIMATSYVRMKIEEVIVNYSLALDEEREKIRDKYYQAKTA